MLVKGLVEKVRLKLRLKSRQGVATHYCFRQRVPDGRCRRYLHSRSWLIKDIPYRVDGWSAAMYTNLAQTRTGGVLRAVPSAAV